MKTFFEISQDLINRFKADRERIKKDNILLKKKFNIKDNDIKKAQKKLSKHYKVDLSFLKFHAIAEYGFKDIVDIYYNIMDPKHKNFKSTIAYRWNPKEERGIVGAK